MENVKIDNVKNVYENVEINEMSEDKISLETDYTPIVRTIKIVPNKTKYNTTYLAVVDINGIYSFKVKIDEGLVNYINLCGNLGVKPFKFKTVVKEYSAEKNRQFVCVKFVTIKDNTYRFFVDRVDTESLEMIFENFQATQTTKKS